MDRTNTVQILRGCPAVRKIDMFDNIGKSLFTKFLIWSSRFEKPAEVINYRSILGQVKRVLIYIPDSIEDQRARSIHERAQSCFPNAHLEYVLVEKLPSLRREFLPSLMSQDQINVVTREDVGFWGILKKNFLENLKDKQFDLVLDFSSTFDISLAHAFRASGAPIIAGFFLGRESELFHNLLIKTGEHELFDPTLFDCLSQLR